MTYLVPGSIYIPGTHIFGGDDMFCFIALVFFRAFFGSIPEDIGNRGESTIIKLSMRNKQWQKHGKKDQTTANRMTVFFNRGMATAILSREFAF